MKKFISALCLCGIYCGSTYAGISENSFEKHPIAGSDGRFVEYSAQLDQPWSFSFFVDTKELTAAPVLSNNGKKYQAISVRYCIDETSDCWRVPLYGDSMVEFVDRFTNEDSEQIQLVWEIEYVDNNNLGSTNLMDVPKLGALSIYTGIDETDESDERSNAIPYIIWQPDVKNY